MSDERLISLDPESGRLDADVAASGRGLYWVLRRIVFGPAVRRLFRPIEEGVANVPAQGAAILAANHLSFADWIFLPLALNRRVTFVAKSDYFTGSGIKGFFQRTFFAGTGQVPIDRTGGRAAEGALRAGLRILEAGGLFGIFPEGTRSHDGRLYKGRTGVARLALQSGAPVVPVALVGTDEIAPPGKVLTKIMSPTVRFGEPLDFSRYAGMEHDAVVLRAITDEIMYAIMELSGQTYVDEYAPSAKEKARHQQVQAVQRWIEQRRPGHAAPGAVEGAGAEGAGAETAGSAGIGSPDAGSPSEPADPAASDVVATSDGDTGPPAEETPDPR